MALINCPECSGQVSDKAKVCLHCGYELVALPKKETLAPTQFKANRKKSGCNSGCLKAFGIISGTFLFLLILMNTCSDEANVADKDKSRINRKNELTFGEKGMVYFDSKGEKVIPDAVFEIYDEDVFDAPIKTSITMHISLEGKYDESIVTKVLNLNYENAKKRTGFKYHNPATHYQILVYPKNHTQWIGLLNKIWDKQVEILINNDLMLSTLRSTEDQLKNDKTSISNTKSISKENKRRSADDPDCLKFRIVQETYGTIIKDDLDKLLGYALNNELSLIQRMISKGEAVYLKEGLNVYLSDVGLTVHQIRITNTDIELWVVSNSIKNNCD